MSKSALLHVDAVIILPVPTARYHVTFEPSVMLVPQDPSPVTDGPPTLVPGDVFPTSIRVASGTSEAGQAVGTMLENCS